MEKKWFIGIDISKKTLDVALYNQGKKAAANYLKISNQLKGFKKLSLWIKQKGISTSELLVCMEHTGVYGLPVAYYLESNSISYSMVSALHLKRSMGISRGKSDKTDAFQIARFCYLHHAELKETQLKSKQLYLIQSLMAERKRYVREQAFYKAYLAEEQIQATSSTNKRTKDSFERVGRYITEIEKEILQFINDDKELSRTYCLLLSVSGIGFVNAVMTIVHTNNFHSFTSARAYCCYVGVAPFEYSSGTSIRGRTKTSKLCNTALKAEISQAALSAIVHDPELRNYYKRKIQEGKHPGTVKNAVKFKIIQRMFAVVKRGTPFVKMGNFAA